MTPVIVFSIEILLVILGISSKKLRYAIAYIIIGIDALIAVTLAWYMYQASENGIPTPLKLNGQKIISSTLGCFRS